LSTAVGLKIEIQEIHQNLRNPVSINRNPHSWRNPLQMSEN